MRSLYRLHDTEPNRGCHLVAGHAEMSRYQREGWGAFQSVNAFRNGIRRADHLERILAWAVDLDEGTKAEMRAKLLRSPVAPSLVIESARGYHAYWNAQNASQELWRAVVWDRLVPYFGADPNAKDVCRILRAPGYLHLKNPNSPFLVLEVYRNSASYDQSTMLRFFPDGRAAEKRALERARSEWTPPAGQENFWDAVWSLDCEEGLARLSGHWAVRGERYTFHRTQGGNLNILVDGKGTSCWIDREKKIGSHDKGGPGLYNWLKWFGHSPRDCVRVLKEIFPHLNDIGKDAR